MVFKAFRQADMHTKHNEIPPILWKSAQGLVGLQTFQGVAPV
ncbi:hypothetical protein O59_000134 [Cellvibrio sp. BR]|nr:hypothetical protein O59_000134 [Cellvibrio sp. BR]